MPHQSMNWSTMARQECSLRLPSILHGVPGDWLKSTEAVIGAIGETMELLGDAKAMVAIQKHRKGKAKYHNVSVLDDIR